MYQVGIVESFIHERNESWTLASHDGDGEVNR